MSDSVYLFYSECTQSIFVVCSSQPVIGKCENKNGVATCICPEGITGEFCENVDACASKPCRNGGQCSSTGISKQTYSDLVYK